MPTNPIPPEMVANLEAAADAYPYVNRVVITKDLRDQLIAALINPSPINREAVARAVHATAVGKCRTIFGPPENDIPTLTTWVREALRFIDLWDSGEADIPEMDADRLTREGYQLFGADIDFDQWCLADLEHRSLNAFCRASPQDHVLCAACGGDQEAELPESFALVQGSLLRELHNAMADVMELRRLSNSPAEREKANNAIDVWRKVEASLALHPAHPVEPQDNGGWIIGRGDGKRWCTWETGMPEWTDDRSKATRYYRRCDAEAVHREDEDAWCVVPFNDSVEPQDVQTGGVEAAAIFTVAILADGTTSLHTKARDDTAAYLTVDNAVYALLAERNDMRNCPAHPDMPMPEPCPHCGEKLTFAGRNFSGQVWTTCSNRNCGANAPESMWNIRTPTPVPADGALREALAELRLWRSLVCEGGVPRYTVTPGAALNTVVTSTDALLRASALSTPDQSQGKGAGS